MLEVVPEIVDVPEDTAAFMSIRYTELIPVLTKSIQQLNTKIENLETENEMLRNNAVTIDQLQKENQSIKAEIETIKALISDQSINSNK